MRISESAIRCAQHYISLGYQVFVKQVDGQWYIWKVEK